MFLVVTCKLNFLSGKLFCVCCVYAPNHNPAQDQFLKDFHPKIDCGDFNEVFDCSQDWAGSSPSVSLLDSSSSPKYLFEDCCVIDIWRLTLTLLLWVLPGPGGMAVWPLILTFLVFRFHWCPLFPLVVLSLVLSQIIVVYVSTTADAIPPGPGLWKLNISILNNPEYVNLISKA